MAQWSLWTWFSSAPWLVINTPITGVDKLSQWLGSIPFWSIIAIAVAMNLLRHRWWSLSGAIGFPGVAYVLGVWPLFIEQFGWWLLLWLSSWGISWLMARYLILFPKCLKLSRVDVRWWPIYVWLLALVAVKPSWEIAVVVLWCALIPHFLLSRLSLFAQIPDKPLAQAAMLGANVHQQMKWVAARWLSARLVRWRCNSVQVTLFYSVLMATIGLPGLGQHILQALLGHQQQQLIGAVVTLLLLHGFLWSLDSAPRMPS
ncbi:hypothetical protein [Celerinatantimonas yamalensis]|uniref:Uncharacterized protein n=1 Tax=Celerinatantimonas yamalensis TaxID=559956 RepID=A0ABW9G686_9GAMM